jgi:excisionase family DNA binding protein
MLGVSRALVFRWMQEGVLPTVRISGARTVRVPRAALFEWIDQNTGTGLRESRPTAAERVAGAAAPMHSGRRGGTRNAFRA